jgi:hypothetical protein
MGLFFDLLLRYLYTINCPDVVKIVRDTLSKTLWPVFYAIIWTQNQNQKEVNLNLKYQRGHSEMN